jgi:DNA-binding CsgD family transcriptional regulator
MPQMGGNGRQRSRARVGEPLSERESEVPRLAGRGMSNRQIATAMSTSDSTVKRHLANVYSKLGVSSRIEAFWMALAEGWITAEDIVERRPKWEAEATRYRCVAEGCGREVVVVRASRSGSAPPIECHGHAMRPVVPYPATHPQSASSSGAPVPRGLEWGGIRRGSTARSRSLVAGRRVD